MKALGAESANNGIGKIGRHEIAGLSKIVRQER